jgi:hypothetical protein
MVFLTHDTFTHACEVIHRDHNRVPSADRKSASSAYGFVRHTRYVHDPG